MPKCPPFLPIPPGVPSLPGKEGVQCLGMKPCSGLLALAYLTVTTWCCKGGFQAPSSWEGTGEWLKLQPWEQRAVLSPGPSRELPPW